ncbi:3-carboxymuconate cyclase (fragment) [Candidatus Sulfotelmatobacter sp. SbA7]
MTRLSAWKMTGIVLLLCAATAIAAPAQTFTTLLTFDGSNGNDSESSLVQGVDGAFYGTTVAGGSSNNSCGEEGCGTAFRVTATGQLLSSHFSPVQGEGLVAGLLLAANGNFYGTAYDGGANFGCDGSVVTCGTVFEVTPTGKITTLYSFCAQTNCMDGDEPRATLIEGPNGDFYGTSFQGGASGAGTVFKITADGTFTTLYNFCQRKNCADGSMPGAGLVQGTDGDFYGTTEWGGPACMNNSCGTIFKITPGGSLTTLHIFHGTDGWIPAGSLVQGPDGNFYGTTEDGGDLTCHGSRGGGCGTIFTMTPSGALTTLHIFTLTDGVGPIAGLVLGTDGNLYGTTSGYDNGRKYSDGTIFQITPQGVLTTLHTFNGTDGANPWGGLLQATNGIFYGATISGGNFHCGLLQGCGTVFSLDMGLGPFVSFVRNPTKVGQPFGVLGQGFTGTTSVSLNGTPASFTVKSDTFLEATVPTGATTGYVTVTTLTGTLTSNVPFHVLP